MIKFCKNCTLNTRIPGITIDDNGLCDYCSGRKVDKWDAQFNVTEEVKERLRTELKNIFDEIKGKYKYDCVLALSGGKDSAYMLYHLTSERSMKVLAVHVKTLFDSEFAERNIEILKKKLNFDLNKIVPPEDFYIKLYSKLLQYPKKTGFRDAVCPVCTRVYIGYCIKVAVENKTPLVITGFSPPQYYFFELSKDTVEKKNWIPDLFKSGDYANDFLDNFWDPSKYPEGTVFPRVISPLHVMGYNSQEIYEKLSQNKILSKKRLSILKTNCQLINVMYDLDRKFVGYSEATINNSYLVRKGMLKKKGRSIINKIIFVLLVLYRKIVAKRIERKLNINFSRVSSQLKGIY